VGAVSVDRTRDLTLAAFTASGVRSPN